MVDPFESSHYTFLVDDIHQDERLDRYLAAMIDDVSRGSIVRWIQQGYVKVISPGVLIKKKLKPSFKIQAGQKIHCQTPPDPLVELEAQDVAFDVYYQDEDLAVVYKPPGIIVHPGAGQFDQTLVNGLLKRFGRLSPIGHPTRPGIVHRIDRDTSGLLMVALSEKAHHHLSAQLQNRSVDRHYVAITWRVPEDREGRIETYYARHPQHRIKWTSLVNRGKTAITDWQVLEALDPCCVWRLKLHSGRTHQIRVHLSEMGYPLLADHLYGQKRKVQSPNDLRLLGFELGMKRHALHAATLGFEHPRTGERMFFEAPIPDDMKNCIQALKAMHQQSYE